jgi:phosphopantetheinyl transferase (holo-ACP synthase)
MRIIGHGIDVVDIARIQSCLDSPYGKWVERVYSPDEREQADQPPYFPHISPALSRNLTPLDWQCRVR